MTPVTVYQVTHTPSPSVVVGQRTANVRRSSALQTASTFQTCPSQLSQSVETASNNTRHEHITSANNQRKYGGTKASQPRDQAEISGTQRRQWLDQTLYNAARQKWRPKKTTSDDVTATITTQQQPFYGPLSGTTRVSQHQKKHSPTILIIIESLSASSIYHDP